MCLLKLYSHKKHLGTFVKKNMISVHMCYEMWFTNTLSRTPTLNTLKHKTCFEFFQPRLAHILYHSIRHIQYSLCLLQQKKKKKKKYGERELI